MGRGEDDKCSGLMLLVHKRLASQHDIQHREVLRGKVQHVRIQKGSNAIDVVNIYQHVWRGNLTPEQNLGRLTVWNAIRRVTKHIPRRSTAIWCGDWNTQTKATPPHAGPAIMECKEQHSPDEEEMLTVLQELGLCFLALLEGTKAKSTSSQ